MSKNHTNFKFLVQSNYMFHNFVISFVVLVIQTHKSIILGLLDHAWMQLGLVNYLSITCAFYL